MSDAFLQWLREAFTAEHPSTLAGKNLALIRGRTVIRQIAGPLLASNETLHLRRTELGVAHEFRALEGASHNHAAIYGRQGDANWEFYRKAFAPERTPPK